MLLSYCPKVNPGRRAQFQVFDGNFSTIITPDEKERVVPRLPILLTQRRLLTHSALLLVVAAGVLLAIGSFLGLYVRPTSDDWCGAWKSRDLGLFGITNDFYETQNGRIANAFVTGIVYQHGIFGPKVFPSFLVISLMVGLILLVRAVWRLLGWDVPLLVVIAVAAVLEVLLFFAGTRSYQVLLWAPATISHTLPSVLGLWSVLIAVFAARRGNRAGKRLALGSAMVVGIAIGTLSEPFTVVSGLFAGTAALLLSSRTRSLKNWYPVAWSLTWCAGLVIGYVLLHTSPGAVLRRAQQSPNGLPLSASELKATIQDWQSVWETIGGQWTYLAAAAVGLILGLATTDQRHPDAQEVPRPKAQAPAAERRPDWLSGALVALPIPLMAISSFGVAFGLRTGYGSTGWTYGRTWTNFLFPMLLLLCMYGVLAGRVLSRQLTAPSAARVGTFTVVGAGAAATVTSLWAVADLVPTVQKMTKETVERSVAWDRQDVRIRKEAASGSNAVAYRPLHIGALAEPYYTPNYSEDWVASCVSHYYGVGRIYMPASPDESRLRNAPHPAESAGVPTPSKPAGRPVRR